jgi:hypothetical protein
VDNGGGDPNSDEGPRSRCVGPVEQARRWTGQLTGVLMQGETVARAEKGRRGARRLLKRGGWGEKRERGSDRGGATCHGGGVGPGCR